MLVRGLCAAASSSGYRKDMDQVGADPEEGYRSGRRAGTVRTQEGESLFSLEKAPGWHWIVRNQERDWLQGPGRGTRGSGLKLKKGRFD